MSDKESQPLAVAPKKLSRNIVNMEPELAERGRIKTGGKGPARQSKSGGTWQPPVRYDHFVITTMTRGQDGNFEHDEMLHKLLAERGCGDPLNEIPVRLLFNNPNLNLSTGYGVWTSKLKTWWCRGDGESAQRLDDQARHIWVTCPCYRNDPAYDSTAADKCKIQAKLRVIIDGASGLGGVWTYVTTSWNSTRAISASLAQLSLFTGGHIAGVPLRLVMRPKTVSVNGVQSVLHVVNLEYRGDIDQLRLEALNATKLQIGYEHQIAELEKQISADDEGIVPAEDADGFYPSQEREVEPEKPPRRRAPKQVEPEQLQTPPPLAQPGGVTDSQSELPADDDDSPF